jgi:predicted HAD superfamily Cof-like phosphohydrolase
MNENQKQPQSKTHNVDLNLRRDNMVHDVARFMLACDHRLSDTETSKLYWNLAGEELKELMDADNFVDELDGIIDSIWTLIGYGLARGYDIQGAWNEVARSNLAKINSDGQCAKNADGKVIKPAGWTPPNLYPFAPKDFKLDDDI